MRHVRSIPIPEVPPEDEERVNILSVIEEASRHNGGVWVPRCCSAGAYYPGSERQLLLEEQFPRGSR